MWIYDLCMTYEWRMKHHHKKFAFEIEVFHSLMSCDYCLLFMAVFFLFSKTNTQSHEGGLFCLKNKSCAPDWHLFIASKYVAKQSLKKARFVHYFDIDKLMTLKSSVHIAFPN